MGPFLWSLLEAVLGVGQFQVKRYDYSYGCGVEREFSFFVFAFQLLAVLLVIGVALWTLVPSSHGQILQVISVVLKPAPSKGH
jgi:hypothetical protein